MSNLQLLLMLKLLCLLTVRRLMDVDADLTFLPTRNLVVEVEVVLVVVVVLGIVEAVVDSEVVVDSIEEAVVDSIEEVVVALEVAEVVSTAMLLTKIKAT
jgi:hypothetical protein